MFGLKTKIGLAIIVYSILMTSCFGLLAYQFHEQLTSTNIEYYMEDNHSYYKDEVNTYESADADTFMKGQRDELLRYYELNNFKAYYNNVMMEKLIYLILIACFALLLFSSLLWRVIKSVQMSENKRIVQKLYSLDENENNLVDDPILMEAYLKIQKNYQKHFMEFKRLNAFLNHEQRNALMLLRNDVEYGNQEEAENTIQYLNESLDDILTISDHAQDKEQLVKVDIILLCADVCDAYQKVYRQLKFDCDMEEEIYILAKPRWIRRAISNLIDNAIKYGDDKEIKVHMKQKNHCVIIEVEDNGIGISATEQKRIFEHRYRIDELKKNGYGIGLSLVAHVCELCNGFVFCENIENKGTKFYLSFAQTD